MSLAGMLLMAATPSLPAASTARESNARTAGTAGILSVSQPPHEAPKAVTPKGAAAATAANTMNLFLTGTGPSSNHVKNFFPSGDVGHTGSIQDFMAESRCSSESKPFNPEGELGYFVRYWTDHQYFHESSEFTDITSTINYTSCIHELPNGEQWHTARFDGLVTTGGYSWHEFMHSTMFWELRELQESGKRVAVTAELAIPIDPYSDKLFGLPPFHIHHEYIITRDRGEMFFERDGDTQCLDALRDPNDCNAGTFGPDFCFPMPDDWYYSMTINDVRPEGSTPLAWSYQKSLRVRIFDMDKDGKVVDPTCTPISSMQMNNPFDDLGRHPDFFPPGVFFVPVAYDTFMIYWTKWTVDGELINLSWFHSHAYANQGVMMLEGMPEEAGLPAEWVFNSSSWCNPRNTTSLGIASNVELANRVRKLAGDKLVMTGNGLLASVPDPDDPSFDMETFDRRVQMFHHRPLIFKKGDVVTTVVYCGPTEYGGVHPGWDGTDVYAMHTTWKLYIRVTEGNGVDEWANQGIFTANPGNASVDDAAMTPFTRSYLSPYAKFGNAAPYHPPGDLNTCTM